MYKPRKNFILNTTLLIVSVLFSLFLVEASYRLYLYYSYGHENIFSIMTTDTLYSLHGNFTAPENVQGLYPPNKVMSISHYSADNKVLQNQKVHVNNYGWISRNNYTVNKDKNEYRISILGDSLTACITNNIAWPDVVQEYLDSDQELKALLKVDKISVLNLGINGIGLEFMADPVASIAKRFSSDMVVINFPIEDLFRRHGKKPLGEQMPAMHAYQEVDGVVISLDCSSLPFDVSNPNCKTYVIWHTPAELLVNEELLRNVKQKYATKMALNRIVLSKKSLIVRKLLGMELTNNTSKCSSDGFAFNPLPTTMVCDKNDENIELGLNSIDYIRTLSNWDVLVTHNPLHWHLPAENKPELIDSFIEKASANKIEISEMQKYLPVSMGKDEWDKWYNVPHDGHWSDHGARLYGKAMYLRIREYLVEKSKAQT